ncbi:MAG: glycosyltransferase [Parvularculaceae bacterium]
MIVLNDIVHDSRVIKMAVAMRKIFDEVVLVGMAKEAKPKPAGLKFFVEGVECRLFPNHIKRVPRFGGEAEEIYLDRRQSVGLDALAKDIAEFADEFQPDCVHTHDMYAILIGRVLQSRAALAGRAMFWIHDVHEFVSGCSHIPLHRQQFALKLEREHLERADRVLTVTDALADKLHVLYPALSPVSVIHNTPERYPSEFSAVRTVRDVAEIPSGAPLAVYAGQVKEKRGVDRLPGVLVRIPELHLAIVTNNQGAYIDWLAEQFRAHSVDKRVRIIPYVSHHQVSRYLTGADVGFIPIENYGNAAVSLPNKLFEYVVAGLPVVAHELDALKVFFEQYPVGKVVDFDDADAAARATRELLDATFDRLGFLAARDGILREYVWEGQERRLLQVYLDAIGASRVLPIDAAAGAPPVSGDLRVLHGLTEAAGQPAILARALDALPGVAAKSLQIRMPRYGRFSDFIHPVSSTMSTPPMAQTLRAAATSKANVVHLHARSFFLDPKEGAFPTGADLLLLKAAGKVVIVHFRGSEARLQSKFKAASPFHYVDDDEEGTNAKHSEVAKERFIRIAKAVADAVVVVDPEIQTYIPDAEIIERAIDLNEWSVAPPVKNSRPLVVHAPSRRGVKGTASILEAVEGLKAAGVSFDFELVEGFSHSEARKVYERADIVIDQLRIGWYGVLAVEAMALGKPVISFIRDDLVHHLGNELPLAIANPDTIETVLKDLLGDEGARDRLGAAGRKWCEAHHAAPVVAEKLVSLYRTRVATPRAIDMNLALDVITEQAFLEYANRKKLKGVAQKCAALEAEIKVLKRRLGAGAPLAQIGLTQGRRSQRQTSITAGDRMRLIRKISREHGVGAAAEFVLKRIVGDKSPPPVRSDS